MHRATLRGNARIIMMHGRALPVGFANRLIKNNTCSRPRERRCGVARLEADRRNGENPHEILGMHLKRNFHKACPA